MSAPPTSKWTVAISLAFGSIMATIDSSIVNVALPHIRGSVSATLQEITWISTAYIIATVLVMPLTGFLGALFGQKRVYVVSLVVFVIGSALCGVARSLPTLVAFRALQGIGAGSLQPTQQAILRQTFPPEEQGMAMALFAMVIMIGPAVGPTLGGYIVDNYSWPWIFYINLPIGALGVLMTMRFVHEPEDVAAANRARAEKQRKNVDWAGIVLLCLTVAALQFFLEEGQAEDWFESGAIQAAFVITLIGLALFIIRELTAKVPVIDLRLFRDTTFLSGTLIAGVMFAMLMGSMFLLPVFMQELLGYDATMAGVTLVPRTLAMMIATPIVGRLYNRVPPALTVALGVVLFAVGSWDLSRTTLDSSAVDFLIPMCITGVGFACLFVPLTTAALSRIPRAKLADAAGLNSFVRQIGGSIGLALFATLLTRYGAEDRAALAAHVTPLRPELAAQSASALAAHVTSDPALQQVLALKALAGRVAMQAQVIAFERTFLVQGLAFVAVLPLLFLLRVDRRAEAPKVEVSLE